MRVGIMPVLSKSSGGVCQYSLTMLRGLRDWAKDGCEDEFVVFVREIHHPALVPSDGHGWTVKPLPMTPRRLVKKVLRRFVEKDGPCKAWRGFKSRLGGAAKRLDLDMVRPRPHINRWLRKCGVQLMLYADRDPLSFETGIPYVMAIHDLQHRIQPEFPEVSANGEWESREYVFRNGIRYATLLLADSEVGKEDILSLYGAYGVTADRVKILPFLPAPYLAMNVSETERQRVRATYRLPERYLFYPAHFWPHKNHGRIVQALGLLRRGRSMRVPLVLVGSYTGEIRRRTFHEVMLLSRQLRLCREVRYLGYVPGEDMAGLYANAVGLVMPTFFGPTNIPVLEAWALGCPVLTSDIRGVREQARHTAILVDPRSVEAIADGIYRLWVDEELRRTLVRRGWQRTGTYTPDDYRRRLIGILREAKARVGANNTER